MAEQSEEFRKQGNNLYKIRKFQDAATLYKRAAESAPQDPAAVSNLAAAYFELGQYDSSMAACDSASSLLAAQTGSPGQEKLPKVLLREARAAVNAAQPERAQRVVKKLPASDDKATLERCIIQLEKAQARDAKAILTRLVLELPRYKSMM